MFCPCCSGKLYSDCCQPYIEGQAIPKNAEALMRSRYSAYSQANIDYIIATMRGPAAENFDPISAKQWAQSCQWQQLEVHRFITDPDNCDRAFVEFTAFFIANGQRQSLHECSEFHRINDRWFYIQGDIDAQHQAKVGRNDPCPCGSGKKYKKCCANNC